ncbi:hypothetical protein BC2230_30360 [Burkholderia cepacia]
MFRCSPRRNASRRIADKVIDRSITREYGRRAIELCVPRKGVGARAGSCEGAEAEAETGREPHAGEGEGGRCDAARGRPRRGARRDVARVGRQRLRERGRGGERLRLAGCRRGVRAASPTRAMRPCANAGPRTSKTAWTSWTDGPAVAIVMLGLSKRASGADIADRKAPESSLDRVD